MHIISILFWMAECTSSETWFNLFRESTLKVEMIKLFFGFKRGIYWFRNLHFERWAKTKEGTSAERAPESARRAMRDEDRVVIRVRFFFRWLLEVYDRQFYRQRMVLYKPAK